MQMNLQYLKQMMNNPQMQLMIKYLSNKNITPEQAVREICQQRGIDVDELIKQLK